jgi:hypothetical protein
MVAESHLLSTTVPRCAPVARWKAVAGKARSARLPGRSAGTAITRGTGLGRNGRVRSVAA